VKGKKNRKTEEGDKNGNEKRQNNFKKQHWHQLYYRKTVIKGTAQLEKVTTGVTSRARSKNRKGAGLAIHFLDQSN